jgi:hypothetical protein
VVAARTFTTSDEYDVSKPLESELREAAMHYNAKGLHSATLRFIRNIVRSSEPPVGNEIITCVAIFLAAILIAVSASRADIALSAVGYDYAYQALLIKNGYGLGGHYGWPPGYPLLMVLFMEVGISALRAGWLVSLLSFAASSVLIFHITRKWSSTRGGFTAAVIFTFNPFVLYTANAAGSEMVTVFLALLACVTFDHCFFGSASNRRKRIPLAIITGILLALPFYVRYLGIVFTALGLGLLVILFWKETNLRAESVACGLALMLTTSLLPLRNLLFGNTLTGHQLGAKVGDPLFRSLTSSLFHLGGGALWVKLGYATLLLQILVVACTGVVLGIVLSIAIKHKRYYIVGLAPIVYVLGLSLAASQSRLDVIGPRYLFPALPFLIISIVLIWHGKSLLRMDSMTVRRIVGTLITGLVVVSGITGIALAIRGYTPFDFSWNYSPETLDYIANQLPKGTTIAGNRFANQILATTLNYQLIDIPFEDPWNPGLEHPFESGLWNRKSAIDSFLRKDVGYVVFFLGKRHADPYLIRDLYGDYISALFSETLPEISSRRDLGDGVVFSLAGRERLLEIRKEME